MASLNFLSSIFSQFLGERGDRRPKRERVPPLNHIDEATPVDQGADKGQTSLLFNFSPSNFSNLLHLKKVFSSFLSRRRAIGNLLKLYINFCMVYSLGPSSPNRGQEHFPRPQRIRASLQ